MFIYNISKKKKKNTGLYSVQIPYLRPRPQSPPCHRFPPLMDSSIVVDEHVLKVLYFHDPLELNGLLPTELLHGLP